MIIEAWAKYRPPEDKKSDKQQKRTDFNDIYGEDFTYKLINGIKMKKLNQEDGDHKNNKERQNWDATIIDHSKKHEIFNIKEIPLEELNLIEDFLSRFIFVSGGITSKETIDLKMALKALPIKVDMNNVYRIDLMNFIVVQKALISFQHDDQDELFNYYDDRNKERLRKLNKKAEETDDKSE